MLGLAGAPPQRLRSPERSQHPTSGPAYNHVHILIHPLRQRLSTAEELANYRPAASGGDSEQEGSEHPDSGGINGQVC